MKGLSGLLPGALAALALAGAVCAPAVAVAQTAPVVVAPPTAPGGQPPPVALGQPSRAEIQREETQAAKPIPRRGDLFARTAPGPCPLAGSPLTFTLRSVAFPGVTAATPAELARAYEGKIGRELPVSEICEIRDRAAAILFSKGVLVRVEIPEQRITSGALTLEVIEARIVSVHIHGDAGPAQAQVESYLEKLRGLRPFSLRAAQRYLLLASDVPGVRINASLKPSAEGRGAVDLEVEVSREAYDVLFSTQNLGSRAIGRWGVLGRADLNGFTRFGERTSLVLYATPDSDEQRIVQITEEARIGSSGLLARGSFAYARTLPGDVLAPLKLASDSYVGTFGLAYPIIRTRPQTITVGLGMDIVNQKTTLPGDSVLVDDRLRVLTLHGQGEWRTLAFGRPLAASLGLDLRRGLDIVDASSITDNALSRTGADPQAFVVRADGRAEIGLPFEASLYGTFFAQYSARPLLTYEQISVGDLTIGRGYDPASVSGDAGAALSVELRSKLYPLTKWAQVSGFAFCDAAYIESRGFGVDPREVHSAGFGLRARLFGRANLDVAYAHPFDKPFQTALEPPSPRVLVTLTVQPF